MNKIEAGMYVRTKDGFIDEVIIEYQGYCNNPNCKYKHVSCKYNYYDEENIVKASHNIIDLIEPMDLMYIDISPDDCGGIVVPRVAETLNELEKWKKRISSGDCVLKGIVTKEQLKNMEYRIGD